MNQLHAEQQVYFDRHLILDPQGRGWLDYRLEPGATAEIVNLEVHLAHRRQGVGRAMLAELLLALPVSIHRVYAFTRASNRIARMWYLALGFRGTPVDGFYGDDDPDAMLYVRVRDTEN